MTLCWQLIVRVAFRQMEAYQGEPLRSLVHWLSRVLRCNCAAVWLWSSLTHRLDCLYHCAKFSFLVLNCTNVHFYGSFGDIRRKCLVKVRMRVSLNVGVSSEFRPHAVFFCWSLQPQRPMTVFIFDGSRLPPGALLGELSLCVSMRAHKMSSREKSRFLHDYRGGKRRVSHVALL